MGESFENNIGEDMPLQEWVPLFRYFGGVATTKIPFGSDTLPRLIQSDKHIPPHNR